jgi:hypothetical protein
MFVGIDNILLIMKMHLYGKEPHIYPTFKSIASFWRRKNQASIRIFNLKYNIDKNITTADARIYKVCWEFINEHIGTASAKILISALPRKIKISLKCCAFWRNQKRILLSTRNWQILLNELKKYQNIKKCQSELIKIFKRMNFWIPLPMN